MSNRLPARTANAVRHCLHYASAKHPIAEVVADDRWPHMWRVLWPDDTLSDMANLSRAPGRGFCHCAQGATRKRRKAAPLENHTTWRGPQKPRSASKRANRLTVRVMPMTRPLKTKLATLAQLDGRTVAARQARDMMADIEADLGGRDQLSTGELQLIQRAAITGAILEDMEAL
jgi:hypothetical protein